MSRHPNIVLLSGGVGGAKLAEGLAASPYRPGLTIIANVGDDSEFHGLHVSPDVDTLMYNLCGQINADQGWGVAGDSYRTLERLSLLGADNTWMSLGDLDFATHIRRTELLSKGYRLTETIRSISDRYGVSVPILVPTDDSVRTHISTDDGLLTFQEYFVRERCKPEIRAIKFIGAETATPTAEALAAVANADLILIAPSNPIVSIGPMLAVPGFSEALGDSDAPIVAMSPLIGGRTVKGPADRMMVACGYEASPLGLADFYGELVNGFMIDQVDQDTSGELRQRGYDVVEDGILMQNLEDKTRLAIRLVEQALKLGERVCP